MVNPVLNTCGTPNFSRAIAPRQNLQPKIRNGHSIQRKKLHLDAEKKNLEV